MSDTVSVDQVKQWVAAIEKDKRDPEVAHCQEDDMYISVLSAIADKCCDDPVALAKEALRAHDIEFPRWCA